jgi:hypothetical protein
MQVIFALLKQKTSTCLYDVVNGRKVVVKRKKRDEEMALLFMGSLP